MSIDVEKNKQRYIELLNSISRENFYKDRFIEYLEASDFFTAPASTKYHGSVEGGLCAHCLCVYDKLKMLRDVTESYDISNDNILIASLFHDLSKINFYEKTIRNKKVYFDGGTKKDAMGHFDWVSVEEYGVKPAESRFIFGSHEQTAEYIARCYIQLDPKESQAILYHMGGMATDSVPNMVSQIYGINNLALLLHLADMLASYIDKDEPHN